METAHDALQAAKGADDDTFVALERKFDDAERSHKLATAEYEKAKAVSAARGGLPRAIMPDSPRAQVVSEPLTYERGHGPSFFSDLYRSRFAHDANAAERIARHVQEMEVEERALNSTDTTGGEFVPPLWMQDEWLALAKAGRPFANAVRQLPLPMGTDSVNLPKVTTGATVATQQDGGAVSSTDVGTGSISIPINTVAGQQDLSRQLFDRSVPGIDVVVFEELTGRYAVKLDTQCLSGSGSAGQAEGILTVSGTNAVTFTSGSPTLALLYAKVADAIQQIHTGRFLPPSAIFMHPRRWGWMLAALDSSNRPLITPYAPANAPAILERVASENIVGALQGLPVIVDASIPVTDGAGTNQDVIIVTRLEDQWLFEDSTPQTRVYEEVLSNNLQVRIQLFGYFGYSSARYVKSTSVIRGTGLVAPTF